MVLALAAAITAAGCSRPVEPRGEVELGIVADVAPAARMSPDEAGSDDRPWTKLDVPGELGEGAVLVGGADRSLLVVSETSLARSRDDGRTWEVTPSARRTTRYTNKGGAPWVDAATIREPWYPHGRLESTRPVVAAGATANRVLLFSRGTSSTSVVAVPLSAAFGAADERVFLSAGGQISDGISYTGPSMASFEVPARPVLVGYVRHRTVVYVPDSGGAEWRLVWRGTEYGPQPLAVRMVTPELGYLLLADGTLYETSDGLGTWQLAGFLPPKVARRARAIAPVGETGLVVVGERGLAVTSTDRGRTWRLGECPEDVDLTAVAASGARVWAVGAAGAVVESDDFGSHYRRVALPVGRSLSGVLARDGRAWILAGRELYVSPEPE